MAPDRGAARVSAGVVRWAGRDVVDVVLGVHGSLSRRRRASAGGGLAGGFAALLVLLALRLAPRPSSPQHPLARPALEISLDEPPAPIPPPRPEPIAASSPSPRPVASRATSRPGARALPVQPAQAARVLAREPPPDEPVDLTGDVVVVGTAPHPARGAIAPTGPSATAGLPGGLAGEPTTSRPAGGPPDRARPVRLAGETWPCPWPSEAEPLPIDEQAVVIRVVARLDGTVESVTVVSDPGHGFGEAAAHCAKRTRLLPARASNGEPVRATSPPIVVRFTR